MTSVAAGSRPEAQPAVADRRVAGELYRLAFAGDRRAAVAAVLASLFVASALERQGIVRIIWIWCAACVALALARLLLIRSSQSTSTARTALDLRDPWLLLLTLAAATWGAGPPMVLLRNPGADTLLTGIWLAAAGLSAPLVAASRPAVYLSLLPALVPLLVTLVLQGSAGSLLLAVLAATFLLVLLHLALDQNNSLALGLAARFENEDLVEKLRAQVEVAARANQEKTRFLASAAHDLRQPLHALGMFCAALDQRLQNVPEKPLVRNMMDAIEALEGSFGAMLDISRLDAGVVQKAPQSFPVRDLFRRLYQHFGGDAEARDLSLRFRAARRRILSDPQLLERVLANLVQNAMRYTRQGGVLVAARRHPQGVALEVWDTGVGIPAEKIEMIFQEFYQIDNPERDRSRGLGMGLAIVQRLCRLLDHPLQVHSKPGRGSVFRVIVPPGEAIDMEAPPLEADTLPPRTVTVVTVLLIDDERAIREATRELLRPMQVDVLVAATIAEALEVARQAGAPIDLILSDWRLRGQENGVDAVRAVRAVCGESTPAVLITGDTSPDLLKLAHENGLIILHKPLQPRELVRLVERLAR
jgi:two-component system, sensor histidine kinase